MHVSCIVFSIFEKKRDTVSLFEQVKFQSRPSKASALNFQSKLRFYQMFIAIIPCTYSLKNLSFCILNSILHLQKDSKYFVKRKFQLINKSAEIRMLLKVILGSTNLDSNALYLFILIDCCQFKDLIQNQNAKYVAVNYDQKS